MLLRLPRLKVLRLSVAPNFLDILDLGLYRRIAEGLPSLEKLYLGNAQFHTSTYFMGRKYYERTPMHHLAVFCNMLPKLEEVGVGCIDALLLKEVPEVEWACPHVKTLRVTIWATQNQAGRTVSVTRDQLHVNLIAYFPNSDLAAMELDDSYYMFTKDDMFLSTIVL